MNRGRGLGGPYDPFSDPDRRDDTNPILIAVKRLLWMIVIGFWLAAIWTLVL